MQKLMALHNSHVPCILLLDTSHSMRGVKIDSLNHAVEDFKNKTMENDVAKKCVDVAIIGFGTDVTVIQEFSPVAKMQTPVLTAGGVTNMGYGIDAALEMMETIMKYYGGIGTSNHPPWIFMVSDGRPTDPEGHKVGLDSLSAVASRINGAKKRYNLNFIVLGVPGYDRATAEYLTDQIIELADFDFRGIFDWLSKSMVNVSNSRPGERPRPPSFPDNVTSHSTVRLTEWRD